jgi:ParB family chromosome partitioning protein
MDDQSNNAVFEPTEPLNDDATASPLKESVDSPCPASPPMGAAVTESPEPDPHTPPSGDEAGGQRSRRVREIAIADITVPPTKRGINDEAVDGIMASMTQLDFQTPITVYLDEKTGQPTLLVGGQRLEAARRLGWKVIAAIIVDWEPDQRRMWEISENLHRAELKALERDEQIAEWINLVERRRQKGQASNEANKPSQVAPVSKGGRGKEGGARAAARELKIGKDDAHRAKKVAGLSEEAKQVARETSLDENRRVLLEATKAEDSVAFLREEFARRDAKKSADADLAPNAAEELADLMLPRYKPEEISKVISLLQATPLKDVVAALRNNDHVMSKGWPGFEPRQPVDTTAHTGGAASQEFEKEPSRSLHIAVSFGEGAAVVDGRAYVFDCDISIGDQNHHFDVPCPIEIGDFLTHAVARHIRRWLDRKKVGSTTPPTICDQTRQNTRAALASKSKIAHKPRSRKSHG